ncbi:MAG: hypothetical protein V4760_19600 [Bdellovibrionota bacterium]
MNRVFELAFVALVMTPSLARAALCSKWAPAVEVGKLDPKKIDESSGLAVSRRFDVLYHNNDSGTGPQFWITSRDGSGARAVKIKDYVPKDPEEIAVGPCPGSAKKTCIALGDIGDNRGARKNVGVFFVEELEKFTNEVTPVGIVRFRYPDGARDAEAFGIMPNGDLVVVTKEGSLLKPTKPARIYRARASDLARATAGEEITLMHVGTIDVPAIVKDKGVGGLVTAMSIAGDGSRFVLLTYDKAVEVEIDLSTEKWVGVASEAARVVDIARLQGQESVSYDRNEKDILYSTEQVPRIFGKDHAVPLMKASCLQ